MSTTSLNLPTAVMWDDALLSYRFNDTHPMAPIRLQLTYELAEILGVWDKNLSVVSPPVASDAQLAKVHDVEYISAVKQAGLRFQESLDGVASHGLHPNPEQADEQQQRIAAEFPTSGLGTEDCPVFADIHESAARIAGGTAEAAQLVIRGQAQRVVNFAGGMHHAHRDRASGFCIYNDAALGITELLEAGYERVAYVDVDAHHGDGVEEAFWDDPRVLTISLHETGLILFPGTGFSRDAGGPNAPGTAVNVALPPHTTDAGYLRSVHAIVPQLLRSFKPQVLVTQHGADGHKLDPLADLNLTVDGQRQLMLDAADWAEDFADNHWIALGGGGYNPYSVVPRLWTHLLAIAAGEPIPVNTEIPQAWRKRAAELLSRDIDDIPTMMGDSVDLWWRSWEIGYDPADSTDQSVMATRKEIFPNYGLDPWFD